MSEIKPLNIIPVKSWRENQRGLPADLVKSTLFRVGKSSDREYFQNRTILNVAGNTVSYTGEELRIVDDYKVLRHLIHSQKIDGSAIEDGLSIERTPMVKEIWGNRSSFYTKRLIESIQRLNSGFLDISSHDGKYNLRGVRLIRKYAFDNTDKTKSRQWRIWLEPEIINLLAHDLAITPAEDEKNLSTQAIKVRDLLLNSHSNSNYTYEDIRYNLLDSKASDKSFKTLFHRICDQLISAGYLKERIKIEQNGNLKYEIIHPIITVGDNRIQKTLDFL